MEGAPNRDAAAHQRLVRLAAWLHVLIQEGRTWFTQDHLARIDGLESLAGVDDASSKARARSLAALEEFGIDVKWSEPDQRYEVRHLDLSERETRALASLALSAHYDDWHVDNHWHILGAFAQGGADAIRLESHPCVDSLVDAVHARRCVTIEHRGRRRVVQPHGLAVRSGRWYLVAHDPADGRDKAFALAQVDDVSKADRSWDQELAPPDVEELVEILLDPQRWWTSETIDVAVAVDTPMTDIARTTLPGVLEVGTADDGRSLVTCRIANVDHFIYRLLELRTRAEVLTPEPVRQAVIDHLEAVARS